ncbi:MAG: polysaccharide biosynthesis C-terminal domain-containing protein [Actinomycetota bacterium]|nr:polysaccharide biosynthesis C-terminal domain-containing protein [Actinomycetota bacterium]
MTTSVSDRSATDLTRVARSGGLGLAGAVTAAAGGFALTVVVARSTSTTGAGLFFEAVALFTIASSVACLGADTGLLRTLSRSSALGQLHDLRGTLVVALPPILFTSGIVTLLGLVWSDQLLGWLVGGSATGEAAPYLQAVLAFLLIGTAYNVCVQATRGLGGVRPFVLLQNVWLPFARLACVVVAVQVLATSALPWAWALPLVPALAAAVLVLRRRLRAVESGADAETPSRRPFRRLAADFWSYSLLRGGAASIDITLVWLDVVLVGLLRSTAEAGIYAAGSRYVTTGTLVVQAMRLATAPELSALLSTGQRERATRVYRTATSWIMLTSWPIYLLMASFPATLLGLFGDQYLPGSTALTVLSLAMLVSLATGNVGTVLLMAGRSGSVLGNKAAALGLNVTLNLVLVPPFGMTGAALAWAAAIVVDNLLAVAQVSRLLETRSIDRAAMATGAAACLCFGALAVGGRLVLDDTLVALLATALLGTALYAAALRPFRDLLELRELAALPRSLVTGRRTSPRSDS